MQKKTTNNTCEACDSSITEHKKMMNGKDGGIKGNWAGLETTILSSKELLDHRIAICSSCENNKIGICSKCSCVIQLKARLSLSKCPEEYW